MKKYLTSNILLRLALASVFLYAGVAMLLEPSSWIGFIPRWLEYGFITRELILYANAFLEILLGIIFLAGKWKKAVGWFAFSHLLLIVAVNGTVGFLITFRDMGLAFTALAYVYLKD